MKGGLRLDLSSNEEALVVIVEAIKTGGVHPGSRRGHRPRCGCQ